ncbi:hypothetical protein [Thermocrinis sp.]|jgi:hypothetical protein|uniref:hypothetical protein n=1 Tax=Thermocrinis sp. TaxID=2024383 RepID=UPI003C071FD3
MFVSLQFRLELKKEDKEKLIRLMRKQSSPIRVAYRRLLISLVFPILGKVLSILVEEVWDRVRSRLASLEVGGASR